MLALRQLLDAVDQPSGAATKIIFGIFVHRVVMKRRGIKHRLDIIGQPVPLLRDVLDFVEVAGVTLVGARDGAIGIDEARPAKLTKWSMKLLVDCRKLDEVFPTLANA